ncbi:trichohyalin-like [Fopius arisanus]|uniref:Trichohyalin-like n=1 Tax=Fopius arisanus TaxID=64838 RepID=A0A9R1TLK4_9HYME|nr:PREDICTED: trichohyalin-like [Fopius arisanus]
MTGEEREKETEEAKPKKRGRPRKTENTEKENIRDYFKGKEIPGGKEIPRTPQGRKEKKEGSDRSPGSTKGGEEEKEEGSAEKTTHETGDPVITREGEEKDTNESRESTEIESEEGKRSERRRLSEVRASTQAGEEVGTQKPDWQGEEMRDLVEEVEKEEESNRGKEETAERVCVRRLENWMTTWKEDQRKELEEKMIDLEQHWVKRIAEWDQRLEKNLSSERRGRICEECERRRRELVRCGCRGESEESVKALRRRLERKEEELERKKVEIRELRKQVRLGRARAKEGEGINSGSGDDEGGKEKGGEGTRKEGGGNGRGRWWTQGRVENYQEENIEEISRPRGDDRGRLRVDYEEYGESEESEKREETEHSAGSRSPLKGPEEWKKVNRSMRAAGMSGENRNRRVEGKEGIDESRMSDRTEDKHPKSLTEGEWEEELKERRIRKKNLIMEGLTLLSRRKKEELEKFFREQMKLEIRVERLDKCENRGWRVKVEEFRHKLTILAGQSGLRRRGWGVYFRDDWTERQKEIKRWLEEQARGWRRIGMEAETAYNSIQIEGHRLELDELEGELRVKTEGGNREKRRTPRPFRGEEKREGEGKVTQATPLYALERGERTEHRKELRVMGKDGCDTTSRNASRRERVEEVEGETGQKIRVVWEGSGEEAQQRKSQRRKLGRNQEDAGGRMESGGMALRKNMGKVLEALGTTVDDKEGEGARIVISGDLNARIGELQGWASCGMVEEGRIGERIAQDKTERGEGRKLIGWCEERAFLVENGRARGDETGAITFIGEGAGLGSTLDYVLVRLEDEEEPKWFKGMKVEEQEGSNHLPVVYNLEWGQMRGAEEEEERGGGNRLRWKEGREENTEKNGRRFGNIKIKRT